MKSYLHFSLASWMAGDRNSPATLVPARMLIWWATMRMRMVFTLNLKNNEFYYYYFCLVTAKVAGSQHVDLALDFTLIQAGREKLCTRENLLHVQGSARLVPERN